MRITGFLYRLGTALTVLALAGAPAAAFETRATAAYAYDHLTDTVLMSKNAETPLPPASMSKLMTLNMLFEALQDGRVTLGTEFRVSDKAATMGGSKMFLKAGERVAVRDLILGIIVNSGNDACVVVAEGLAGTEQAFARLMTERAQALGLEDSTFANASGWPHPDHRMSMKDIATLVRHMIKTFPELYSLFSEQEYHYQDRAPANRFNRNPLLGLGIGADGLKTGHTQEAGFGLAASAEQGGRRVTVVYSGLETAEDRAREGERLLNWAFRQFTVKSVGEAGQEFGRAAVWLGAAPDVGLVLEERLDITVPALVRGDIDAELRVTTPVPAPVRAGDRLGELVVQVPDMAERRVPLVAASDVATGGLAVRLRTAAQVMAARYLGLAPAGG